MDASEHELDARLYKASGELLSELRTKLPLLVCTASGKARKWVLATKVHELTTLLDRFQEWPQLLDPYLSQLVSLLADSFLTYCVTSSAQYIRHHEHAAELYPLARAVTVVLYAFCKIRGSKVIVRLLNNEPKYVEPILFCFRLWNKHGLFSGGAGSNLLWEEKYVMLMWLSHLMLAPFELATISGRAFSSDRSSIRDLSATLPDLASNLLDLALCHLENASRDREAACALVTRLALRSDMQALGLSGCLTSWAIQELRGVRKGATTKDYRNIGILSLLYSLSNSASDTEAAPFIERVFIFAHELANTDDAMLLTIRDSAPARKLLIKIVRSTLVHAMSLASRDSSQRSGNIDVMTEEAVQMLLELLADNDTPVRQAASKSLGLITLRLDPDMASQITEAVLDGVKDGVLLQDVISGALYPLTETSVNDTDRFIKNVDAVDPLLWHGSMLTLGHLLFRRALPISQLPLVIEALLVGLEFERRSSVGTSVGVAVRDASCFGTWSLARKYSSAELLTVPATTMMVAGTKSWNEGHSQTIIQIIATSLVASACLDTSGNLRRGSSAALQELIGRHPDVVLHGIPVVQVVDYHAVARRSRAMTELVAAAARLDSVYHQSLAQALLRWRGVRATDRDSRRQAATAVKLLLAQNPTQIPFFQESLLTEIHRLKPTNVGANAAARHGLLLALAAVYEVLRVRPQEEVASVLVRSKNLLLNIDTLAGPVDGRVTPDLDGVLEAISSVISAAASLSNSMAAGRPSLGDHSEWVTRALPILERCTTLTDNETVINSAAIACVEVFGVIDTNTQTAILAAWLDQKGQSVTDFTSKGRIAALSALFNYVSNDHDLADFSGAIVHYLCTLVTDKFRIETKINAMQGISRILESPTLCSDGQWTQIQATVNAGLSDYTLDQRGDIGSLLRSESVHTAQTLQQVSPPTMSMQPTYQLLVKLAVEKLGRVRYEAWTCLARSKSDIIDPRDKNLFQHQADVSSPAYFRAILQLLTIPTYHDYVLLGLISSSAAGSDDINRASSGALLTMLIDQDPEFRQTLITSIHASVVKHVEQNAQAEDREVVPALDFLTFLHEHVLLLLPSGTAPLNVELLWHTCQMVHNASPSMARLEALVRLYSIIGMTGSIQLRVLDRLSRMLLHRWPKIRLSAAESIFLIAEPHSIAGCDWTVPIASIKPQVLKLRKDLGIAGAVTSAANPA